MGTLKIMPCLVASGCLALAAAEAAAQDPERLPSVELFSAEVAPPASAGPEFSVEVVGRYSVPSGTVDSSIPAKYNDLFQAGPGVSVEGNVLFSLGPRWKLGPYLSFGWDHFGGKGDTDSTGDTLTPKAMEMTTFLVGGRATYDLGQHFTWDVHLAMGAAHYSKVDGTLVHNGSPMDVGVFKSSTAFAFDIGTRFSYAVGQVFFDLGIDLRSQGAPANADFDFSSGALVLFGVEAGVGVRF
jgi:hypothetical protein